MVAHMESPEYERKQELLRKTKEEIEKLKLGEDKTFELGASFQTFARLCSNSYVGAVLQALRSNANQTVETGRSGRKEPATRQTIVLDMRSHSESNTLLSRDFNHLLITIL